MRNALSIAGSDPTGGAGVQADLQVFCARGVHGSGVITALTVQDSSKVHQVLPAFPSVVLDQLRVLLRDIRPDAIKLGMLASDDVARQVGYGLELLEGAVPIVVDPVLQASDGTTLLERRGWAALVGLLEGCALVTPNLSEAELLTRRDTSTRQGMEAAARAMVEEFGAKAALVKGGHREHDADDLLAIAGATGTRVEWLRGERIDAGAVHGTGCALSAAITAGLARGNALEAAIDSARHFVADALRDTHPIGSGARFLGFS